MVSQFSFLILGIVSVLLSCFMVTRKRSVSAAIILIVLMMALAGMYGMLGAHFSAVSQIIVYAGAIMVVFVFVIMLLNITHTSYGRLSFSEMFLALIGFVVALFFGTQAGHGLLSKALTPSSLIHARAPYYPEVMNQNGKNVAALMFTDYLWSFEMISFLILASVIGVIVIAKREKKENVKPS